jgi:hypothetical protein
MAKKKNSSSDGKKPRGQALTRHNVRLDGATIKMALKLGEGDVSLGIRRAVALASLRKF